MLANEHVSLPLELSLTYLLMIDAQVQRRLKYTVTAHALHCSRTMTAKETTDQSVECS